MRIRRVVGALTLLASYPLITSCAKPTPYVAVFSGGTEVHAMATLSCRVDGDKVGNCRTFRRTPPRLTVTPGDVVGIDVARNLVHDGWYVAINGQRSALQHDHYFKIRLFGGDFGDNKALEIRVFAVADLKDTPNTAAWAFTLVARQ
ncbi:MAG: hypothetical protein NVSMB13_09600 [Mycobacteriales bacterium]